MKTFDIKSNLPGKNMKGFTIIELLIVILILSTLASMAYANFTRLKRKAYDSTALTDTRNLADSIIDVIMSGDDVDFAARNANGDAGCEDTASNPISPVFQFSSGVSAIINQAFVPPGNDLNVTATIHHTKGTAGKSYILIIDESTGTMSMP